MPVLTKPREQRKEEGEEKSKRVIAAVGDGNKSSGSISTYHSTPPNMYNRWYQLAKGMHDWEKLKAEREANRGYSLKIGDLENDSQDSRNGGTATRTRKPMQTGGTPVAQTYSLTKAWTDC